MEILIRNGQVRVTVLTRKYPGTSQREIRLAWFCPFVIFVHYSNIHSG